MMYGQQPMYGQANTSLFLVCCPIIQMIKFMQNLSFLLKIVFQLKLFS